jgi:hypothetical protein
MEPEWRAGQYCDRDFYPGVGQAVALQIVAYTIARGGRDYRVAEGRDDWIAGEPDGNQLGCL